MKKTATGQEKYVMGKGDQVVKGMSMLSISLHENLHQKLDKPKAFQNESLSLQNNPEKSLMGNSLF
jgi:hypothetical protein